jgi:hypothetical protein
MVRPQRPPTLRVDPDCTREAHARPRPAPRAGGERALVAVCPGMAEEECSHNFTVGPTRTCLPVQ